MEEKVRLVTAAIAVVIIMAGALLNATAMKGTLGPWYGPVVEKDEVLLAEWADANIAHNSLYAADLFACEMITATARGVCTIGGAWELADNANKRFFDNERAFTANTSIDAWQIYRQYNVKYVLVSPRQAFYGYGYKLPSMAKFDDAKYFKLTKQIGTARLYEVKTA